MGSRTLLGLLGNDCIGNGASVNGQSVVVAYAAQLYDLLRWQIEFEQFQHLSIAILLDYINAVMALYEFLYFRAERVSSKAQVINLNLGLSAQLVACFQHRPMRSAI